MTEQDKSAAAYAAVGKAEAAAHVVCALAVFDAIDGHTDDLTPQQRYDLAFAAWQTCVDCSAGMDETDVARLAIRAYPHLPEEALIDLVDIQLGDQHTEIVLLDDKSRLDWRPDDDAMILSFPARGGAHIEAVLLRRVRTRS